MVFEVSYTVKDLILYALSIGMGSETEDVDELKYLYEQHDKFSAVPTFCLALTFWANEKPGRTDTHGIPNFPPPLLAKEEVIPKRFLRPAQNSETCGGLVDISNFPVIHSWQSILWHRNLKIPRKPNEKENRHCSEAMNTIDIQTILVQPKSIGTFVTTQSILRTTNCMPVCTMQSTALVLGISPENVVPFDAGISKLSIAMKTKFSSSNYNLLRTPDFQWSYQTHQSQTLLYRLASGDSNRIHVDTSASVMMNSERKAPLLHGLFTLALAFRAITKYLKSCLGASNLNEGSTDEIDFVFRRLEGKFTQPAFLGDCLCIKIWADDKETLQRSVIKSLFFRIVNEQTGHLLVDHGFTEVGIENSVSESYKQSRL